MTLRIGRKRNQADAEVETAERLHVVACNTHHVEAIEYVHAVDGLPYRHDFKDDERGAVIAQLLSDGSVRLVSTTGLDLWATFDVPDEDDELVDDDEDGDEDDDEDDDTWTGSGDDEGDDDDDDVDWE